MKARTVIGAFAATAAVGMLNSPVLAGSHTWRVNEIFSNADGTIQFVELRECCGGDTENNVGLNRLVSDANSFNIPGNVAGLTGLESILFGTAAYDALPGTTVDFTIPAGFFSVAGDTVRYGSNPPAFQYDFLNFGAVPTDGCTSLNRIGAGTFTATNSPENFGGLPGIVFAEPSDINGDLAVNVLDLVDLLLCFGQTAAPNCLAEDVNGDGSVNVLDLIALLLKFGTSCS